MVFQVCAGSQHVGVVWNSITTTFDDRGVCEITEAIPGYMRAFEYVHLPVNVDKE